MKVELENLSPVEKKLFVEIPAERVKDEIELAYKELNKNVKLKGYRVGKVPRKVLESLFGEQIKEQVVKKLVQETIPIALDRKKLKPLGAPSFDAGELDETKGFSYTVKVEVKPEIELKQYLGLELEREVFEVDDSQVERVLSDLREKHAIYKEVTEEREIRDGDLLLLNIEGRYKGKTIPEESAKNIQYRMGEEAYIPEFPKAISGMRKGEKRTFTIKFPDEHPKKELAGKEIQYTVELNSLKEKILSELNDEFAKEVGDYPNLLALKAKIREQLENYFQRLSKLRLEQALFEQLVSLNPIEVPQGLVQRRAVELARSLFSSQGINNPPLEELEKLAEQMKTRAERDVKTAFILEAIIDKEGIKLTEEEEKQRLSRMSNEGKISVEEIRREEKVMEYLRSRWLEEKAVDFLLTQAKIKNKVVKGDTRELEKEPGYEPYSNSD